MNKKSSLMSKVMVLVLALAVVFTYSVMPMNQAYAASSKKPAQVKSLKAAAASTSSIKLTWKKAKNAKKYQVYMATSKKGKYKKVATVSKSKKTYTKKSLKAGTKYYFKVRAINGKKKGKFSAIKYATTKKAPPKPTPKPEPAAKEIDATLGETKIRTMTVDIDMTKYENVEKGIKVWVPIPQSDEFQTISNVDFKADNATKAEVTTEKEYGNKMLYVYWDNNVAQGDRKASLTYTAKRYDVSKEPVEDASAGIPAEAKVYITKGSKDYESEFVKVDAPIVKETAAAIVADKKTTLEKARAIYEWVINNLERIDNGEKLVNKDGEEKEFKVDGCGYGDTVAILTDLKEFGRAGGHCTDINSTFVALCRAAGIPAREMFGIRMGDNATGGQHCWTEVYIPGSGWVYADPGDVLKFGVKGNKTTKAGEYGMTVDEVEKAREDMFKAGADVKGSVEYYWGHVDNDRIVLSTGRDVTFEPAQAWGVCNTFGYPAAEIDGQRLETSFADAANFVYTIKCTKDRTVFVDADYVKDAVDKGADNTVIAEVSWGPDAPSYMIKGAIHVNTDDLESNGQDVGYEYWDLRGFNNNYKELIEALGKYGITKDTELICYSQGETNSAVTRLAMAALMMGVEHVRVLDGGVAAYGDKGYPMTQTAATPVAKDFGLTEPLHPEWVISTEEMLDKVESDSNFKLVSIRSYDEFIGANSGYAYIDIAGEPKGAVWGHDTDDGSYFIGGKTVDTDKINEYLAPYGASTENELAFYCGTGWRATIPFLICYEEGIDNMKLWDDGWYVYSGACADGWNWTNYPVGATDENGNLIYVYNGPAADSFNSHPVQIGDPAKGAVEFTTVGDLWNADTYRNPLRGLSVKNETVKIAKEGTYASNFEVMPPKGGILKSVKFTSGNEDLVTVNEDGTVTVNEVKPGEKVTVEATGYATSGSTPDAAGTSKSASYTIEFIDMKDLDFVKMDAEEWAQYGITYDEMDLEKDLIIDVRNADMYNEGHIPGSINCPVGNPFTPEQKEAIAKLYDEKDADRVVIVCVSGNMLAKNAMNALKESGADMKKVTYLKGGAKGVAAEKMIPTFFSLDVNSDAWKSYGITKEEMGEAGSDIIIDVRKAADFEKGNIVGSENVPTDGTEIVAGSEAATALEGFMDEAMTSGERIVLICYGGNVYAKRAMDYLYNAYPGIDKDYVTYLIGGYNGYVAP